MIRALAVLAWLLSSIAATAQHSKPPAFPSYDYEVAQAHEIKPHRSAIPMEGIESGLNQLRLKLTVSPTGDVIDAEASNNPGLMKFWPRIRPEILRWKFTPFEQDGKSVSVELEEYIDLIPPERLPKVHIAAPIVKPNAEIAITLKRTGCFGSCPSYTVSISTTNVSFDGYGYVVVSGHHTATVDPEQVRKLAEKFVAADFYSMDADYHWPATDLPTYVLSIAIDGRLKKIQDYAGQQVGMPAIIAELEEDVDALALSDRWIEGTEGLVYALQAERFEFDTLEAQRVLKEAASRGKVSTVQELLDAGVPLTRLPAPKPNGSGNALEEVAWLNSASEHPEALQVLINAEASKDDQNDKDLALARAAASGEVKAAQALIAYGANPNADLSKLKVSEIGWGMTMQGQGAGSVLIYAAQSGNPEMVREILFYHPDIEKRDREGKTAVFAAGTWRYRDRDGARVACVRLLSEAGANVNAHDNDGNTPLHETFLADVEEELLRLGADVNARNNDGETPIFTTVDDAAILLFIEHGADLTIRNKKGETVLEAAKGKGPMREEVLRKAIENAKHDDPRQ